MCAKRLLQNMKGYKLANNDLDPIQLESLRQLYGNDEGKILGAIMAGGPLSWKRTAGVETNRTCSSVTDTDTISQQRKRRRRKRKRNSKRNPTKEQIKDIRENPQHEEHAQLAEKCGLCASKLVDYSSDSSSYSDQQQKQEQGKDYQVKLELPSFLKDVPIDLPVPTGSSLIKTHTLDSDSDSDTMGFFYAESSSNSSGKEEILPSAVSSSSSVVVAGEQLSAHVCFRCGKIGHMSNDCLMAGQDGNTRVSHVIPGEIKALFARCRKLKANKNTSCIVCGVHSNLVNCLDCGSVVCDGRGHISEHLLQHPSHTRLFSYKLGKVVKCCKPSCGVVDAYQLLVCPSCFSKIFNQHYSMITATWSATGLKAISNSLCCDEHFQWHRMNCQSSEESLISKDKLESSTHGTLSEFIF